MSYRDETDALRARNEALEGEVRALKADAARLAAERDAAVRGALPKPPPSPPSQLRLVMVGVMTATGLLGGVVAYLATGTPRPPPSRSPAPTPVHATWKATVRDASGEGASNLPPGTPCTLSAALAASRGVVTFATPRVTCGSVVLYDAAEARRGGGSTETSVEGRERGAATPAADGQPQRVFELTYDEKGPPLRAVPRAAIDTGRGLALFVRESPELRVMLDVAPGSAPVPASAPPAPSAGAR